MPKRNGNFPDRDDGDLDREILDIIPERFDSDPDSRQARKGAVARIVLPVALGLLLLAALGVTARHILFGEAPRGGEVRSGTPVIRADDKPIKIKPQDPGGMDVPNQDKLVYERMGANGSIKPSERLLPPPEQPQVPPDQPRKPSIRPAFPSPPVTGGAVTAGAAGGTTADAPLPLALDAPAGAPPVPASVAANPPIAGTPAPAASSAKPAALPTPVKPIPAPLTSTKPAPVKVAQLTGPQATPTVPPPQPATAPVSAGAAAAGWLIQLGSLETEDAAKAEWNRARATHKDLLGALSSDIVRVDLGAKGIHWRLRAGPLDEAQARTLCSALAKQAQACLSVRK